MPTAIRQPRVSSALARVYPEESGYTPLFMYFVSPASRRSTSAGLL
jgi:hypothetical protein